MITIRFNDDLITLTEHTSLINLLDKKGYADECCAVSLNNHIIPKTDLANTMINDHDIIDIITPMQGG